ncbi:MAG: glycosyltransferase [Myxacorys chilensis ATA2-1-KO14]|jgi:glycosyltransferase involved in cell wall biosynthesis|nr:glycosyltransferase [Myxacorys chilensis ATA2-1-KO14]
MTLPKISIVTPSYNQGNYLERTILSILNQSYPNLEYIIIDGGSTDNSIDIIRRHEKQLAYWISEPDCGQSDALIKGFKDATGDIFCWLCSDDLLMPGTLHSVANFFHHMTDAQFVYGDTFWIDDHDAIIQRRKETGFSRFICLYEHNFIPQPSAFWKRGLYEEVGGLNPNLNMTMDFDLWIRFSEITKVHHVRQYWSCMRLYPEQKTQRLKETAITEGCLIRQRYYGNEPSWSENVKRLLAKGLRWSWKFATGCYWT